MLLSDRYLKQRSKTIFRSYVKLFSNDTQILSNGLSHPERKNEYCKDVKEQDICDVCSFLGQISLFLDKK